MLHIAVCDDNIYTCSQIEEMAIAYGKRKTIAVETEVFYSAEEFYRAYCDGFVADILFLDIEMVSMSGVELGRKIRDELHDEIMQIIYVSSYQSYAMELFKSRPLDFLIKPVHEREVSEALDKAARLLRTSGNLFYFKSNRGEHKLPVSVILYFERVGRTVELNGQQGKWTLYESLEELSGRLREHHFISCHQSFLVNYSNIKEFYYDELVLVNGDSIPVSQKKRKSVRELLLKYKKEGY